MTLINITSVAQESTNANEMQIVARWKDTDKRPISAANRIRAIVLPATIWKGDEAIQPIANQSLQLFVHDAIADLAKDYLSTIVEESNWIRTQVPQESFTLASLLAWNAERAALSGRLNGEEIKKWIAESVTINTIAFKHGAEIAKALGEQFVKLASPNHGLTPEKASKILANLWNAEDANSNTGLRVQLRLDAISKKNADSANVLDSIL
jgi:hypothetical protein